MNDETVLISPSKMCQNHTHTQGGGWYKTNEVNADVLCAGSTKWKVERPITLFCFVFGCCFCGRWGFSIAM